ncbi:hypothetical protein IQ254_10390 [Nodosilinea sp. LEGE 07088]|uniref:hypothetical protein n=1 Tax=Nodosilinea sp. LEGE 07088 TaxID=2777968 RepID=UPI0018818990|nr:hypothetical protein [Nodosilinea sp. LEGE 07088]MBE9137617.1 hypothetical protein [Nodosilinea sp. LEGE 07088]
MFESKETPGTGSLPVPPSSGTTNRGTRSLNPEKVRHLLYGSLAGIDRTIKSLHALGYAEPNDWSEPMPVPPSSAEPRLSSEVETWMVILTKTLLLE